MSRDLEVGGGADERTDGAGATRTDRGMERGLGGVGRYLFGLLGEAERKKNGFYEKAKFVNAEVAAVSVLQEP